MKFMRRTAEKMTKMFSTMEKEMDDVFDTMRKDLDEAVDVGPLPDDMVETVTEETETKPDGTVIHRKITRRTSAKVKPTSAVVDGEKTGPHIFVPRRTNRFVGDPTETCEYCGKDPRNILHDVT